jgi:hypothetical protein
MRRYHSRSPVRRNGASTLEYAIVLILTALITMTPGCLSYTIAPLVLGWLLAAFLLPLVGVVITWWQAALALFILRIIFRFLFRR